MKIFTGKDITPPSAPQGTKHTKNNNDGVPANQPIARPSLQASQALSTLLLYAVVGGCAGFAIRGTLYMVGYKDWMFNYHQSFIAFNAVLKVFNDRWGHLALIMTAFIGLVYCLIKAASKFRNSNAGR